MSATIPQNQSFLRSRRYLGAKHLRMSLRLKFETQSSLRSDPAEDGIVRVVVSKYHHIGGIKPKLDSNLRLTPRFLLSS